MPEIIDRLNLGGWSLLPLHRIGFGRMRRNDGYWAMKYVLAIGLLFVSLGHAAADTLGASAASAISAYRRQHGLSGVSVDPGLTAIASQQAHAMARAGVLSHSVSGSFQSRVSGRGLAAENIAAGARDLSAALDMWKRSAGHRANLLRGGIRQIGIASASAPNSPYKVFWALVLAGSPERRTLRQKRMTSQRMQRAATARPGQRDVIKYCGEAIPGMARIACE
jgi:Cysteine-rich secretory protein family